MATVRPVVTVFKGSAPNDTSGKSVTMPTVFTTPVRPDLVQMVHTNMAKNTRQAYGVKVGAGYDTAADGWGTGRAVSRIPRVPGGGTHRSGQGAFGNMCRGGGMFAPTRVWRRWHRKTNVTLKRHAQASALAASAVPALCEARGHRIDKIAEVPTVITDDVQALKKTKQAVHFLKAIGMETELKKVVDSKCMRAGRGKTRNRRFTKRRGPLIVYAEDNGIVKAFRNIPGVELCHVDHLNLLQLAPGGHLGRFCIWSEQSFRRLAKLYGTYEGGSIKKGYRLHRPMMTNADLARIINSNVIQSAINPMKETSTPRARKLRNPLKDYATMCKLNPAHKLICKKRRMERTKGTSEYQAVQDHKAQDKKAKKAANQKNKNRFYKSMVADDEVAVLKE